MNTSSSYGQLQEHVRLLREKETTGEKMSDFQVGFEKGLAGSDDEPRNFNEANGMEAGERFAVWLKEHPGASMIESAREVNRICYQVGFEAASGGTAVPA